ncbi:MAG: phosphomannomutase/phosphoglucomutase [Bdellovibrionales bacterium]
MDSSIFREYDIRGVFEKDYDLKFAYNLGRAYISLVEKMTHKKNPVVSVGYDARLSSPSISEHLIQGMVDSGAKVFNLGQITSPISYFSTFTVKDISGGIMVTGSHNPPEYNGFKISVGKTTIHGSQIKEIESIIKNKDFVDGNGSTEKYDIFPSYLERYKEEFKGLKPIKVVLDCGNGAAGCIVRKLYNSVGLEPEILFEEPDGTFPNHHPDPTVEENLDALKAKVKETGAVVGIGFDGDADRIGIVDGEGNFILGDEMMLIFARAILKDIPGAKIIGDVKCSDRLYNDINAKGGKAIMWKTGHSLIKNKIKEENAPFGGELSGHIFFADRNYGYDDALYAGLRLVEILSKTGKTIGQLLEGLPPAFNTPEIRIDTTEEKKHLIVNRLKEKFANDTNEYKVNMQDGVRVSFVMLRYLEPEYSTRFSFTIRAENDAALS